MREINLFTAGDATDIKTWSNVPYFFSRAVEQKGIRVNRINLIPEDMFLYRCYMYCYRRWSRLKGMILKKLISHHDPDIYVLIRGVVGRKVAADIYLLSNNQEKTRNEIHG